jgi:hypothetical protein
LIKIIAGRAHRFTSQRISVIVYCILQCCIGIIFRYKRSSIVNIFNLLPHEHIAKIGCFHWKASCNKFQLLWIYEKCFNTDETWHKCWLDHSLCNSMLKCKFPVTSATGDVSKLPKITILHCFFSKGLQLLDEFR